MLVVPTRVASGSFAAGGTKRRCTLVMATKHDRNVEAAAAATFVAPWLESVTSRLTERIRNRPSETSVAVSHGNSLKHKLVHMESYQMFLGALDYQVGKSACVLVCLARLCSGWFAAGGLPPVTEMPP